MIFDFIVNKMIIYCVDICTHEYIIFILFPLTTMNNISRHNIMYTYIFCTLFAYYLLIMINDYVNGQINKFIKNDSHCKIITEQDPKVLFSTQNLEDDEYKNNTQEENDKDKEARIQKSLSLITIGPEKQKDKSKSKSKEIDQIQEHKHIECKREKRRAKIKKKQKCKPVLVLSKEKEKTKSKSKSRSKSKHNDYQDKLKDITETKTDLTIDAKHHNDKKCEKEKPSKYSEHTCHEAKQNDFDFDDSECINCDPCDGLYDEAHNGSHNELNDEKDKGYHIHLNHAKKNKIVIKKIYNYYNYHNHNQSGSEATSEHDHNPIPDPCPCDPCDGVNVSKPAFCDVQYSNVFQITDLTPTYIRFKIDTKVSYTLVGGGGAGGIGFCVKTLFFNGGGGCAGDTKQGIVDVKKCDVWKITVGKGGCSRNFSHGKETMIECFSNGVLTYKFCANGGQNGSPCIQQVYALTHDPKSSVIAGDGYDPAVIGIKVPTDMLNIDLTNPNTLNQLVLGGQNLPTDLLSCVKTKPGENGSVVTISSCKGTPGNGGFTPHTAGPGSHGSVNNIFGHTGSHGSGGGGGMCWDFDPAAQCYSGSGGSGYVVIQCIPDIGTKNTNVSCVMDVSKNSFC